jgi:hypothetical protein
MIADGRVFNVEFAERNVEKPASARPAKGGERS